MDEPSLGLAPLFVKKIFEIINEINKKENTTILLVEQNANIALQMAKRAYPDPLRRYRFRCRLQRPAVAEAYRTRHPKE